MIHQKQRIFNLMIAEKLPDLKKLTVSEKKQLLEELWDDIRHSEEELPIESSTLQLLEQRREEYIADPDSASTWEEVKKRLLGS